MFDGVGRTTFDGSISALRRRGVLLSYGWASGQVPPFDIDRLSRGSLMVARVSMTSYFHSGCLVPGKGSGAVRVDRRRRAA